MAKDAAAGGQQWMARGVLIVGTTLFLGLFAAHFFAEFDPSDDILLLHRASRQSVLQIFTSSYLSDGHVFFYRPLPTLLVKALLTDGLLLAPYRLMQLGLGAIFAAMLLAYLRRSGVSSLGMGACLLLLVTSPFLRAAFTWLGDITTLTSLVAFAAALHVLHGEGRARLLTAIAVAAVALLCKELGVVVVTMFCWRYLQRRQLVSIAAMIALLAGYFALRYIALGSALPHDTTAWAYDSGLLFLTPAETRAMFGDFPAPYYVYNVLAQIVTVFFWQPVEGVIRWMPPRLIALTVLQTASSLLLFVAIARRRVSVSSLFVVILIVNAFVSYRYANVRHIPLSAVVWVVIVSQAISALWHARGSLARLPVRAVIVAVLIGWAGFAGLVLADTYHAVQIQRDVYRGIDPTRVARPDLSVDQSPTFRIIQSRHL
ncbi:MAG: hypothetical protein G01um101425_269 [Candidatus Peregrinibacteria bacterium Gr01-1014_25]|nr:MAG: hypothetical protein G01um101425_269 [Candidatus Peregrinibacteria bacterium Gr01-1014_25]